MRGNQQRTACTTLPIEQMELLKAELPKAKCRAEEGDFHDGSQKYAG